MRTCGGGGVCMVVLVSVCERENVCFELCVFECLLFTVITNH